MAPSPTHRFTVSPFDRLGSQTRPGGGAVHRHQVHQRRVPERPGPRGQRLSRRSHGPPGAPALPLLAAGALHEVSEVAVRGAGWPLVSGDELPVWAGPGEVGDGFTSCELASCRSDQGIIPLPASQNVQDSQSLCNNTEKIIME